MVKESVITYVKGDATSPIGNGKKVIAHISNDIGGWGAGFVMAISKKWKEPEEAYRTAAKRYLDKNEFLPLGEVQFVQVENDIVVANMIGQHKTRSTTSKPIRYGAVKECLIKVNQFCIDNNATLHAPRFGSGLVGGDWNKIEEIINSTMSVPVTIYDFN